MCPRCTIVRMKTPAATTRKKSPPSDMSTKESLRRLRAARRKLDAARTGFDEAIYQAKRARATNEEIQKAADISLRGSQLAITRHLERQDDNAPAEPEPEQAE